MIQKIIKKLIRSVFDELEIDAPEQIGLEHPADLEHGDYSSNVAMVVASQTNINPRELAEKIVNHISKNLPTEVEKVEVAGPGFINFYLSSTFFANSVKEILDSQNEYGSSAKGDDKTIVVEYSSPNIAKPFTVGHLRSTVIGDALANILAFSGYSVVRDNHLGDWGTQFGKTLYALNTWGDVSEIEDSDNPVKDLVDLYVRFHQEAQKDEGLNDKARRWFARLEENDAEAVRLWEKVKTWSLSAFEDIYKRLGVSFDTTHGESNFAPGAKDVIEDLKAKNLLKDSEGAKLVFFEDEQGEERMPPLMIEKSDGTTTYAVRDLATDRWRRSEYGKDIEIVNEVGSEQTLYFRQLYETEELLGYFTKSQRNHVSHGLFRFEDRKMSTREGNVIWLEEIIDEAVKRAKEFNPDVAEEVGIGAIKFNDLKRDAKKDIVFDWDEVMNLEGDSGPYVQYTYARALSVLEKAQNNDLSADTSNFPDEVCEPEKWLYRFPEVVSFAARELSPQYVATYLLTLSKAFNTFYGNTKIIDSENENTPYRLALTKATAQVLKNGLKLLGITAPKEM